MTRAGGLRQWLHLAAMGVPIHAAYLSGVWSAVKLRLCVLALVAIAARRLCEKRFAALRDVCSANLVQRYMIMQRRAATRVTRLVYLVPPCTALLAWLLLGERLLLEVLAGPALTVLGVGLVVRQPVARNRTKELAT